MDNDLLLDNHWRDSVTSCADGNSPLPGSAYPRNRTGALSLVDGTCRGRFARIQHCLIYLNDVEQGGGTYFPNLDVLVESRKGRMLLFHNCHLGTTVRHENTLHGGLLVESGGKWACNFWFREKPYQNQTRAKRAAKLSSASRRY